MLFAQTWRNFQKAIHYVQKSRPKSSCLDKSRFIVNEALNSIRM